MTGSQGIGRLKPPLLALRPWRDLALAPDEPGRLLAEDVYFGGYPPTPVDIPWTWVRGPLPIRRDRPLRVAEVTQAGTVARAKDPTLTLTDRVWKFAAVLDSVVDVDPPNLAKWVTDYYRVPRPRAPELVLVLNGRTEAELYRILRVRQGTRIALSSLPADWPPGTGAWIVEGVAHQVVADERIVAWNLAPVIGVTVGSSGPWFYSDDSRTSSSDAVPF